VRTLLSSLKENYRLGRRGPLSLKGFAKSGVAGNFRGPVLGENKHKGGFRGKSPRHFFIGVSLKKGLLNRKEYDGG